MNDQALLSHIKAGPAALARELARRCRQDADETRAKIIDLERAAAQYDEQERLWLGVLAQVETVTAPRETRVEEGP